MERHRFLRSVARCLYRIPGVKPFTRTVVRWVMQRGPLSLKNGQRLYNFFSQDVSPKRMVSCRVRVPRDGQLNLSLDLRNEVCKLWYYWGYGYEKGVVRLYCELLKSKHTVFDVRANIGYYTMLICALLKARGEVHAFEPYPAAFRLLSSNAGLNGFRNLHLNSSALSDQDGKEDLYLPFDDSWATSSLIKSYLEQKDSMPMEAVRFDTYCHKNRVGPVDLVKIDVEGGELKVLKGMGALLDAWRPDIICEAVRPFDDILDEFFPNTPYCKFVITREGLVEAQRLKEYAHSRDYYLSCNPIPFASGGASC